MSVKKRAWTDLVKYRGTFRDRECKDVLAAGILDGQLRRRAIAWAIENDPRAASLRQYAPAGVPSDQWDWEAILKSFLEFAKQWLPVLLTALFTVMGKKAPNAVRIGLPDYTPEPGAIRDDVNSSGLAAPIAVPPDPQPETPPGPASSATV